MIERKDGSITIISSIGGLKGSTVLGAYSISKAADMQLARNLACEYGKHNIRVNCIAPGLIKTDFAKALWDNPETLKASTARSPLLRIGEPDEIAGAAVFLASRRGDVHDRADHRHRRRRDDQLRLSAMRLRHVALGRERRVVAEPRMPMSMLYDAGIRVPRARNSALARDDDGLSELPSLHRCVDQVCAAACGNIRAGRGPAS